ncbi:MAG: NAD(+)/NADH kinase [Clostridia bacterium]|nr:NAD(+)/NADH kinase [Clostridia bacterium]
MLKAAGLVLNRQNEKAVRYAGKAAAFLRENRITAFDLQHDDPDTVPDLIVTFGGDGTLLMGAGYALRYDIPLLGINLGTVGFLTEEDPDHLEEALGAIIRGDYQLETRSLLRVLNGKTGECFYALNDAVITRGGYARLIRVDASVNGKEYASFTADGIIAATPTGSTGYSLSAGGPIIEPGMNCIVITPVCPHSMMHCPCIVPEDADIRFLLNPDREQTAELQIDGRSMGSLNAGDEIHVTGTEKKIRLIRLHEYDFFGLTRRKLSEWGS